MTRRKSKVRRRFVVRNSGIHGMGVFATTRIPAGTRLVEYKGERLTGAQADNMTTAMAADAQIRVLAVWNLVSCMIFISRSPSLLPPINGLLCIYSPSRQRRLLAPGFVAASSLEAKAGTSPGLTSCDTSSTAGCLHSTRAGTGCCWNAGRGSCCIR